jgi:IS5 family transposase
LRNQVQGTLQNSPKKCAPTPDFVSQNQVVFKGSESPFEKKFNPENRWVVLGNLIPWNEICDIYLKAVSKSTTG